MTAITPHGIIHSGHRLVTMRAASRPEKELGNRAQRAEQDGWSMAYQLTSLGISVLALGDWVRELIATPVHELSEFVGAPEARVAEIMALRDSGVTVAGAPGGAKLFARYTENPVLIATRICRLAAIRSAGVAEGGVTRHHRGEPKRGGGMTGR